MKKKTLYVLWIIKYNEQWIQKIVHHYISMNDLVVDLKIISISRILYILEIFFFIRNNPQQRGHWLTFDIIVIFFIT
jgi:hypothetical protein